MNRLITLLAASLGFAAAQDAPITTVATTAMIADVVQNVAGECAEVTALMGPGVDPHLYTASASDVRLFQNADIIYYSGYALEGQLGDLLEQLSSSRPTIAVASAGITPDNLISVDDIYGIDPHLWMDASLWQNVADVAATSLAELAPDCASDLEERASAYKEQLSALHEWAQESVATIPESQRVLVTAHDAFGYYSRAYGIEVAAIQGISTEAEAAIGDVRETVATVVERGVPAIFVESSINPRTIEAVQQAAADQGAEVEIGGELYSDAMGDAGTPGGTYIGMIYENTVTITEALGGQVPPLPDALAEWAATWDVASN